MNKLFDVIGMGNPCVDYCIHVDSLPESNQSRSVQEGSWQGGGVVPTGLVAASRCGLKVGIIGAVGDDIFGRFCCEDFINNGVDITHLLVRRNIATDMSTIISDSKTNGRSILYRRGNCKSITESETDFDFILSADWLYIDYCDEYHVHAAKFAQEHGIKVLIDASAGPISMYEEILPYINCFIASEFVYKESWQDTEYKENTSEILTKGPEIVVFTFGSNGARGVKKTDKGIEYCEVPAFHVDVKDTVGAGDTFHGAFFYGIKKNDSLYDTIRFASAVSAIKCTCMGGRAGIPVPETTVNFLKTGHIDRNDILAREKKYSWGLNDVLK